MYNNFKAASGEPIGYFLVDVGLNYVVHREFVCRSIAEVTTEKYYLDMAELT